MYCTRYFAQTSPFATKQTRIRLRIKSRNLQSTFLTVEKEKRMTNRAFKNVLFERRLGDDAFKQRSGLENCHMGSMSANPIK